MPHHRTVTTTHEIGHFEGKRYPAGTEVEVRPYATDPAYWEICTPDGFWLIVTESDFEEIGNVIASTGGVEITDPELDESGRFEVPPDYHEPRTSIELTIEELVALELVLIDAKSNWDRRHNHGAHDVHRRALSTTLSRVQTAGGELSRRRDELLAGGTP